jgi:hypothetical protein
LPVSLQKSSDVLPHGGVVVDGIGVVRIPVPGSIHASHSLESEVQGLPSLHSRSRIGSRVSESCFIWRWWISMQAHRPQSRVKLLVKSFIFTHRGNFIPGSYLVVSRDLSFFLLDSRPDELPHPVGSIFLLPVYYAIITCVSYRQMIC